MYKTSKELFQAEYVSYTRLSCYEKCPRQFKLRYLEQIPCPPSRAAQLGSVVHAIIAKYLEDISSSSSVVETELYDLTDKIVPTCKELREEGELTFFIGDSEIETLLRGFVKLLPRIDGRAILGIEIEKNFKVNQYRFKAILDLILCNANRKFKVIDFKTGKSEYVDDLQIKMYAMPLLNSTSVANVDLVYAFLKTRELKRLTMDSHSAVQLARTIIKSVHGIEADDTFLPNPSFLCKFCGVREYCPDGNDICY